MKIEGQIKDKNGSPLPSASITVVNSDFASLGIGTVADEQGRYSLDSTELDNPDNRVMISFVGHAAIDVSPSEANGIVTLSPEGSVLQEVVVTAKKRIKQLTQNYTWYQVGVAATVTAVIALSYRFYKGYY